MYFVYHVRVSAYKSVQHRVLLFIKVRRKILDYISGIIGFRVFTLTLSPSTTENNFVIHV